MFITYDQNKNRRNIEDRNLSFDRVADLDWNNAWIYPDTRNDYNEIRYIGFGMLDGRLHFVCFTETETRDSCNLIPESQ